MATLPISGDNLTIDDLCEVIKNPEAKVAVDSASIKNISKSREFLEHEMTSRVIYGVNTGFGPMASHIISPKNLAALQENLVMSHAAGIGKPINNDYVLAAMIIRLNMLAKGYSGVSVDLVRHLQTFINKRIIPIVPEHGAVGTSGDLVQLAHIALALIGKDINLKKFGIKPYTLKPKEGLALINGTSVMTGISAIVCDEVSLLLSLAIRLGALGLELVAAFNDGISETLHGVRPHPGQVKIAKTLRSLLASSRLLRGRDVLNNNGNGKNDYDTQEIPEDVQEVYSLRCIPQILGPALETLQKTHRTIEIEMNSVSDNPIVDWKSKKFLHGGNFHGDVIAVAIDQLKASVAKMTILSERQINFFLNCKVNHMFPPFLNMKQPGLNLALQGLQFVATSTTAQSQSLAFPHNVHSIPTNGDNQDVVSMGTDAALMAAKVTENLAVVLAIEAVTLAQAVDIRDVKDRLSKESGKLFELIRSVVSPVTDDRPMTAELHKLIELLHNEQSIRTKIFS